MPASYTHQQFGNQVLTQLNNKQIKEIIKNNLNYYNIGLQGPDILFFYHPLKQNSINRLGNQLHQKIAHDFFIQALTIIKHEPSEQDLAYIFGFINHFILDSECHGYIDKTMLEKQIGHFEIERDLDQRFLILNHEKFNYSTPAHYQIDLNVATVIAPFFTLEAQVILTALKSFKLFNQFFACQNRFKRAIVLTGMRLVKAKSYYGMVMQAQPEQKIIDNIDTLVTLFNHAIELAAKEIIKYYYCYQNNNELSNRFNYNYE